MGTHVSFRIFELASPFINPLIFTPNSIQIALTTRLVLNLCRSASENNHNNYSSRNNTTGPRSRSRHVDAEMAFRTRTGLERGGEGPDSAEDEGGEDGRDTHDRLVYSRQTRGDCLGKQPGGDLWRFYTPQGSEKKGKMKREGHFLVAAEDGRARMSTALLVLTMVSPRSLEQISSALQLLPKSILGKCLLL